MSARASANRYSKRAAHAFTAGCLLAWWVYGQTVEAYVMPGPWAVAVRLGEFFTDTNMLTHMFVSFGHIVGAVRSPSSRVSRWRCWPSTGRCSGIWCMGD